MGVNFWGVVHGVRAFLPTMAVQPGGGHFVNTASIAGLLPGFGAVYDASKHAVVAMSEDLYTNMQGAGLPIGVSVLCPGWVRTSILDAERNWPDQLGEKPPPGLGNDIVIGHVRRVIDEGTPPAVIADLVADAVEADRFWVLPHPDFNEIAVQRWHDIAEGVEPAARHPGAGSPVDRRDRGRGARRVVPGVRLTEGAHMALPHVVSQDEWLAARKELLAEEKAMTRARDALEHEAARAADGEGRQGLRVRRPRGHGRARSTSSTAAGS